MTDIPNSWIPPIYRARPCGARTRAGAPCRGPALRGKARCRMHGGAAGSGAQAGNCNARRHGYWSAALAAERRRVAALIAVCEQASVAVRSRIYSGSMGRLSTEPLPLPEAYRQKITLVSVFNPTIAHWSRSLLTKVEMTSTTLPWSS